MKTDKTHNHDNPCHCFNPATCDSLRQPEFLAYMVRLKKQYLAWGWLQEDLMCDRELEDLCYYCARKISKEQKDLILLQVFG